MFKQLSLPSWMSQFCTLKKNQNQILSNISRFLTLKFCQICSFSYDMPETYIHKIFICNSIYRISSYSFRINYSYLNLEIQRSQYIRAKVTVHKCAETIQGRKLFMYGNYMRKYGRCITINKSSYKSKFL